MAPARGAVGYDGSLALLVSGSSNMEKAEVQDLFVAFASPMLRYVAVAGGKDAVDTLARNLWGAMIAGPELEAEVWRAMEASNADAELVTLLRHCYVNEMKQQVTADQLALLREQYGFRPSGEEPGQKSE